MNIDGNKTYIGGVLMIVFGVGGLVMHFIDPSSEFAQDPNMAFATIAAGWAIIGGAHKVEKIHKTLNGK